jgi:glycyl-tRNA synthetase
VKPKLTFQELILRLERFWADQGCIIWQPLSEKVGAGTMNPATVLRVLGPEPWNVAYVEPSFRPDDGRFGENPNRMQMHTQYQVILKPDPGNPQELYLDSLEALGLDRKQHDIRFVEDNWESPALGAWGLGWEVWLDGLEITQFTYFQQAGGLPLDPVAVEITYGLERIAMYLQDAREVWQLSWNDTVTYGDILKHQEVEYCNYEFHWANVKRLQTMYTLYAEEAKAAVDREMAIPAHDYVLRCSHTFNLLDTRGAIGVTDRARYFAEMRDLARQVAEVFVKQREEKGFPLLTPDTREEKPAVTPDFPELESGDLLLELGTEELPPADVLTGLDQLGTAIKERLGAERLTWSSVEIFGTPRRLVALVNGLSGRQPDEEKWVRGPAVKSAYDDSGNPTRALEGFCRGQGVDPVSVEKREDNKGVEYVFAHRHTKGRKSQELLTELLPDMISNLSFPRSMRWNSNGVAFSRPLRWIVALFDDQEIPFEFGRATSGRISRGLRPDSSPEIHLGSASDYLVEIGKTGIIVDRNLRRDAIRTQIISQAESVGGTVGEDPALLDEVTDLVERPFAILGKFDEVHLDLPQEVLISVMKKHQRYFPVTHPETGDLLPYFITVSNGQPGDPEGVIKGNEAVIRARYADAAYFYREDQEKSLDEFLPRLDTLTFQEDLGSVRDKISRIERLLGSLLEDLAVDGAERETATRAAHYCKADLASSMVVEMTSLQGIMGRYYAIASGEPEAVGIAIEGHYHPRYPGDSLPETRAGFAVSVADRLDSLAGLFCAGVKPRATADPYGLRRDALGLLANLVGHNCHFSLSKGLRAAADELPLKVDPDLLEDAKTFILRRFSIQLKEEGFAHDVVEAALGGGSDDPVELRRIVEGLTEMVASADWLKTLHAYSRCRRLVRDLDESYELSPETDEEESSRLLHSAYDASRTRLTRAENPVEVFASVLIEMREPIDRFFEEVLVMDKNPELRNARLALLQHITLLADGIADLSHLEGF